MDKEAGLVLLKYKTLTSDLIEVFKFIKGRHAGYRARQSIYWLDCNWYIVFVSPAILKVGA